MNFIYGDKFAKMADFICTIPNPDDYYNYPNTFSKEAVEAFNGVPIIYTLTGNVASLFKELQKVNKQVIVITHSADVPADKTLYDTMPETVIKWFAQNVTHVGEKLHGLPIGIENPQRISFHHQDKQAKLLAKMAEPRPYKNLLYLNCSVWTRRDERTECYKQLAGKPWVTTVTNPNIFDFDGYIDNIHGHKFVACPRENGIDTHRTWESLYLEAIPIERESVANSFWKNLPILFVNEWSEVTEELLHHTFDKIMKMEWNLEKLEFPYWEKLIRSYAV